MSDWCADYLEAQMEAEEAGPWEPQEVSAEELAGLLAAVRSST